MEQWGGGGLVIREKRLHKCLLPKIAQACSVEGFHLLVDLHANFLSSEKANC